MGFVGKPLLLTIPVSHYCEKARWALDRCGVAYVERGYIQVLHYMATLWHARSLFAPALVTADGVFTSSTQIVVYADRCAPTERRLFPPDPAEREQVQRWMVRFDDVVGVETRRWLYQVSFDSLSARRTITMVGQGVSPWQRFAARALLPLAIAYLRWRVRVTPANVQAGLERLEQAFEQVSRELADGRRYLVGDRFSAADLTFASLSALVLLPPEYPIKLLDLDELPPSARSVVERFRATPAGQFALRLYAEERA